MRTRPANTAYITSVAILDADKEGFLRSNRSLTQTIGRAARHVDGKAILYADKVTASMQKTIDQTEYRRTKQIEYNTRNNITPTALVKKYNNALIKEKLDIYDYEKRPDLKAAEEEAEYLTKPQMEKKVREKRKAMETAAKELDFMQAARLRDEIKIMQEKISELS